MCSHFFYIPRVYLHAKNAAVLFQPSCDVYNVLENWKSFRRVGDTLALILDPAIGVFILFT